MKRKFKSDGQQFLPYKKNEQPPLTQTIEHKKATTYGLRNLGP